ncbi:hypothetical protein J1614_001560 [Plenodomus biglobosus]|nr:hypothetical protein J1614_001560 [Plenodomus biglobosus]
MSSPIPFPESSAAPLKVDLQSSTVMGSIPPSSPPNLNDNISAAPSSEALPYHEPVNGDPGCDYEMAPQARSEQSSDHSTLTLPSSVANGRAECIPDKDHFSNEG